MNATEQKGRRRYVIPSRGYEFQHTQTERGKPLSDAEDRVMHLICEGLTRKEMADRLSISIKTVEKHASRVHAKWGTDCAVKVLRYAIIHGHYKLELGIWPGNPT